MERSASILFLAPELMRMIFNHLMLSDQFSLAFTNKRLHSIWTHFLKFKVKFSTVYFNSDSITSLSGFSLFERLRTKFHHASVFPQGIQLTFIGYVYYTEEKVRTDGLVFQQEVEKMQKSLVVPAIKAESPNNETEEYNQDDFGKFMKLKNKFLKSQCYIDGPYVLYGSYGRFGYNYSFLINGIIRENINDGYTYCWRSHCYNGPGGDLNPPFIRDKIREIRKKQLSFLNDGSFEPEFIQAVHNLYIIPSHYLFSMDHIFYDTGAKVRLFIDSDEVSICKIWSKDRMDFLQLSEFIVHKICVRYAINQYPLILRPTKISDFESFEASLNHKSDKSLFWRYSLKDNILKVNDFVKKEELEIILLGRDYTMDDCNSEDELIKINEKLSYFEETKNWLRTYFF